MGKNNKYDRGEYNSLSNRSKRDSTYDDTMRLICQKERAAVRAAYQTFCRYMADRGVQVISIHLRFKATGNEYCQISPIHQKQK